MKGEFLVRKLVIRSLRMHRVQSVSIAVSVALSVMILVTFGLVYGGVMQGVEKSEAQGGADVMAVPEDSLQYIDDTELLYTGAPAPIYMDQGIVDKIAESSGAAKVSAQFYSQTLNQACCSSTGEKRLIGIDTSTDFVVTSLAGESAVQQLDEHNIIVGSDVDGVYNGTFKMYDVTYNVIATMDKTGTEFDSSIVVDIDLARSLSRNTTGYEHYWEKYGDPSTLVSCVMVDVEGTAQDDGYDQALSSVKAAINLSGEATPLVRSDIVDKSQAQLKSVFTLLAIAAGIMLAVTLLQLFARFYSSVWDRKAELSLYRAVGASKGDLKRLVLGELGALVLSGLVVGAVLGFTAQAALLGVMQDGLSFPYVALDAGGCAFLVLAVVVVFVVVSAVSAAWPLKQIGRIDPSAAMQQGDID